MIENIIGNHKYTIDDSNVIEVVNINDPAGTPPWHRQPHNLYGLPFASSQEAEAWIVDMLTRLKAAEEEALANAEAEITEESSEGTV